MKKLFLALAFLALISGLGFAGGGGEQMVVNYSTMSWDSIVEAAKEEGSVTFYTQSMEEFHKTAAQKFEEEYGIRVRVVQSDLNAIQNKILAEQGRARGTVDVSKVGGGDMVKTLMDAGVFYGPLTGIIPHADKLDPRLSEMQEGIPTNGYLIPTHRNQATFLYDPERVSDPPQTWNEFVSWIQRNQKQFAFTDPTKGGTGQAFVQTALDHLAGGLEKYYGDTEVEAADVANWDAVWEALNEFEQYVTITGSNNESIGRLNQGEVSLVVAWDDATARNMRAGSLFKRAKNYIPQLGLPGGGDTVGLLKNAPHKAAGILFIAFLTEADTQRMLNELAGSTPARMDVRVQQELVSEQERQQNGTAWIPGPYKDKFKADFVENVIMK
jgi:putative spermidine/putrescine transport system substrate-binding protein